MEQPKRKHGGARPGSGPKPRKAILRLGDGFHLLAPGCDGTMLEVVEVGRNHVAFEDPETGQRYLLVR